MKNNNKQTHTSARQVTSALCSHRDDLQRTSFRSPGRFSAFEIETLSESFFYFVLCFFLFVEFVVVRCVVTRIKFELNLKGKASLSKRCLETGILHNYSNLVLRQCFIFSTLQWKFKCQRLVIWRRNLETVRYFTSRDNFNGGFLSTMRVRPAHAQKEQEEDLLF